MFVSEEMKYVLGTLAIIFLAVQFAAKRWPHIRWLQAFRMPELSPERKAIQRRRANVFAGAELILFGVVLPLGYGALTIMMFNEFDPLITVGVIAASLFCIGLGVTAIVKSRS
jgi:hypothetical protein